MKIPIVASDLEILSLWLSIVISAHTRSIDHIVSSGLIVNTGKYTRWDNKTGKHLRRRKNSRADINTCLCTECWCVKYVKGNIFFGLRVHAYSGRTVRLHVGMVDMLMFWKGTIPPAPGLREPSVRHHFLTLFLPPSFLKLICYHHHFPFHYLSLDRGRPFITWYKGAGTFSLSKSK